MNKVVIVTGGAGYIGSHTVVELFNAGFTPVILDDFRNSQPWIIERLEQLMGVRPLVHEVDCQDAIAVVEVFARYTNCVGVIHFAADKAVGESVANPVKYYQNNVGSLCVILNAMKRFHLENLVFSSSCTVYGESDEIVVTEESPVRSSVSPYGDTKITCERIIRYQVEAEQDSKAFLLRYFNPIGAHPSGLIGELPQGVPNNLVPYITQTAKGIREKLTVFGGDYHTPDGTNIRDYIHVCDLAKAHVLALNYLSSKEKPFCDVLNLGTGKGTSVLELITTFEKVNELKLNYTIGDRRSGDVEQIYANTQKAKEVLDWSCDFSLGDALRHSWQWEKGIKEHS